MESYNANISAAVPQGKAELREGMIATICGNHTNHKFKIGETVSIGIPVIDGSLFNCTNGESIWCVATADLDHPRYPDSSEAKEAKPNEAERITALLKAEYMAHQYCEMCLSHRVPMQGELDELWNDYCHANNISQTKA